MWNIVKKIAARISQYPPIYIFRQTITEYQRDRVLRMGAALAYYTIFSLPLIIIIVIGLVGMFFNEAAVEGEIFKQMEKFLGAASAAQVENAVKSIGSETTSWWATMISVGVLIFGATGVFSALQEALNTIFGVQPEQVKGNVLHVIINKLISFGMVLSVGFILIASFILNAVLLAVTNFITENKYYVDAKIPSEFDFIRPYLDYFTSYLLLFLNQGLTLIILTLFFALIYKILPNARIAWRHVFRGALLTSLLFMVGQFLLGIYLSTTAFTSAYGAAGSLIVLLLWVYYSAQLVFLGAEYIKVLYQYKGYDITQRISSERVSVEKVNAFVRQHFHKASAKAPDASEEKAN